MTRKTGRKDQSSHHSPADSPPRIIGGKFRGRKLIYSGEERTRPMKDRVREAVFNLVGPSIAGKHAIDLFAGTGALGLEALSRGAASAIFVERHFPTAALIRQNIETLAVGGISTVLPANTLLWSKRLPELPAGPWVVFCSPPYDFYVEQAEPLQALIHRLIEVAPVESIFVIESDDRFDPTQLPRAGQWDTRRYPPAVISLLRLPCDTPT